jgi:hypothetical protein
MAGLPSGPYAVVAGGWRRRSLVIAWVLLAFTLSACRAEHTHDEEADRLAVLLNWQPDSTVADIGAGEGRITLDEPASAGFQVVKVLDDWPNHSCCVVFRRPSP